MISRVLEKLAGHVAGEKTQFLPNEKVLALSPANAAVEENKAQLRGCSNEIRREQTERPLEACL